MSITTIAAEAMKNSAPKNAPRSSEVRSVEKHIRMMYKMGASPGMIRESFLRSAGIDLSLDVIRGLIDDKIPSIHTWQFKMVHSSYIVVFIEKFPFRVKARKGSVPKEAYLLTGIDLEGNDDILGLWVTNRSSELFWMAVMSDLRNRGAEEILVACTDSPDGFAQALSNRFPFAEIQKPVMHLVRTSIGHVSAEDKKSFLWDLAQIYSAGSEPQALEAFHRLEAAWSDKYPLAVQVWKAAWSDLQAFFRYPEPVRELMYSNWVSKCCYRKLENISKTDPLFVSDLSLLGTMYLVSQDVIRKPKTASRHWMQNMFHMR